MNPPSNSSPLLIPLLAALILFVVSPLQTLAQNSSSSEVFPSTDQNNNNPSTDQNNANGNAGTGGNPVGGGFGPCDPGYVKDPDNYCVLRSDQPPIANAGTEQTVKPGDTVSLDGSASRDPDGTVQSYSWEQTSSGTPPITLNNADTANPTFTAPAVSSNTTYTLTLTVTDNAEKTASSDVNVNVNIPAGHSSPTQRPAISMVMSPDNPKSDSDVVYVRGNTNNTAAGTPVTIDWGDNSTSDQTQTEVDGSWGKISHVYRSVDVASNPDITATATLILLSDSEYSNPSVSLPVHIQLSSPSQPLLVHVQSPAPSTPRSPPSQTFLSSQFSISFLAILAIVIAAGAFTGAYAVSHAGKKPHHSRNILVEVITRGGIEK